MLDTRIGAGFDCPKNCPRRVVLDTWKMGEILSLSGHVDRISRPSDPFCIDYARKELLLHAFAVHCAQPYLAGA